MVILGSCGYVSPVIWLLRHGDASDDAPDDASRPLTEKGQRQSRAAGEALATLGVQLDACLASPKLRARDTARIACEALDVEIEETDALRGGDFDPHDLAAGRREVLLVGHEPDFSRAIQAATGARVELKKGGLAAIEDGTLVTLLRSPQLRAIAR
jgi:phosphohistidine phosphatase